MPSSLIGTLVVGAIIGWLASIIGKTNNQMGCLWNIVVGVVGAALGNFVASKIFNFDLQQAGFNLKGFLIGIAGALLLVILLKALGILKRD